MTMSSGSSSGTSECSTESTAAAGSISQTARGFDSALTKSGRLVVPLAPLATDCCTASAWLSIDHAVMAGLHQALHHVGAHAAQADHAEFHCFFPLETYAVV